jgi:uncharacterized protein (DUF488 family)
LLKRPLKLPTKSARARADGRAFWNDGRTMETADFFTIGYEGRKTDELIATLRSAGVQCVLDVRFNPVSVYRPELSKANFEKLLARHGLSYFHIREWGVPRDIRAKGIEAGSREPIWEWYDDSVVEQFFQKNLHRFLNLEHPVAMMCMERDPSECHRHLLFNALEAHGLRGFDL